MERLYTSSDMAKLYCEKCSGCGQCCRGMGDSIRLDPYDLYLLCKNLNTTAEELLRCGQISLHAEDGLTLPHLSMTAGTDSCAFLDQNGRCRIHAFRPGICRLFPLGRDYDADTRSFKYFIVEDGCTMPGKSKVKISKWLGVENLNSYENFIAEWHYFIRDAKQTVSGSDPEFASQLSLFILKVFYLSPYSTETSFYDTFVIRLRQAKSVL